MVSVVPKHMAAFILGVDHAIYRKDKGASVPDTQWTGWVSVGGIWMGDPVTIKRIDGEGDIFMVDANHCLNHSIFNAGQGLRPWKNLGGKLLGPPAVTNSKGTIHIFHIGTDRALYHNSWDGTDYTPLERLGGLFTHTPAAVSVGEKSVSVFAVGLTDGLLHHYHWKSTSGWAPVEKLPGVWAGTLSAVSDQAGCWDVFGVDANRKINHISDRAGKRSDLETIDGLFQTIDAISWGPERIDLIALGLDSSLHHKAWDHSSWGAWEKLGGSIALRPTPVSHSPGALSVLVVGSNSIMYIIVRNPQTGVWGPYTDIQGIVISRVG